MATMYQLLIQARMSPTYWHSILYSDAPTSGEPSCPLRCPTATRFYAVTAL